MGGVQDVVKQKLKIRWVDARKLSCQAQSDLGIQDEEEENARQDEIVKQAIAIFNLLSTQEQDEMRIAENHKKQESELIRRAREQAEKREREFEEEERKNMEAAMSKPSGEEVAGETSQMVEKATKTEKMKGGKVIETTATVTKDGNKTITTTRTVREKTEFGGCTCSCTIS